MAAKDGISDFRQGFIRRTAEAREAAGLTQEAVATILGIAQDTYKQYEVRSALPHRFILPFCAATRISLEWLFGQPVRAKRGPTFVPAERRRA